MEIENDDLVLILKNAGNSCNIGCKYCAEARKEKVNSSKIKIVTDKDIDKLIEITKDVKNLTVLFHGGEPLILPIDYYDGIVRKWRESRHDVYFGFQTNATLIDENWIDFFNRNRGIIGISISLDGDEISNSNRVDKEGNPTFGKVIKALRLLEENNLTTGVISTLTQSALHREQELFDIISSFTNIRFLKLNPCYDMWEDGTVPVWGILPDEYVEFVINFFNIMYKNEYLGKVDVEPALSVIKSIEHLDNSFCNFCEKKCEHFMSIYPDGRTIACDNFDLNDGMYPDWHYFESIKEVLKQKPMPLFRQLESLLDECNGCNYKELCHSGCLAVRRRYSLYGKNNEKELYCREMQHLIDYIQNFIRNARGK